MDKSKKVKKNKNKKVIIVLILIFIVLMILALDVRLKTVYYTEDSEKIDGSVRVALITDLHSCYYGKNQSDLIDAIDEEKPDVVLLGGDIFDDGLPYENAEIFIREISEKYKCYYVTGNHEVWTGECQDIINYLEEYDVKVLRGTYDTIEIDDNYINICGIDDPEVNYYEDLDADTILELENLENVSANNYYTILLAHRPEYIDQYLEYEFDLILSGHAHGGQWRLPGLINGIIAPGQGLFPKYAGGEYEFANGKMIVSRGLARESTRIPRIFNRPELVIIEIK